MAGPHTAHAGDRDSEGNVHHHTRTYMEEHGKESGGHQGGSREDRGKESGSHQGGSREDRGRK
jgi:hypothetical protein